MLAKTCLILVKTHFGAHRAKNLPNFFYNFLGSSLCDKEMNSEIEDLIRNLIITVIIILDFNTGQYPSFNVIDLKV